EPRAAIATLDRGASYFTRHRSSVELTDIYLQRARALRGAGDPAAAVRDYTAAMAELEKQRTTIRDMESRLRFLDTAGQIIQETVDLQLLRGDVAGAFAASDRGRMMLDDPTRRRTDPATITGGPSGVAIVAGALL